MKKFSRTLGLVSVFTALASLSCFAEEGASSVVTAITGQVSSLQSDAITVIGAAVGLGAVFFGARLLWSKFKGMAK